MCPEKDKDYVKKTLSRVIAKDDRVPSIKSRTRFVKINGYGQTTPVSDFNTIMEILWTLPGTATRVLRRKSAETMCRVMGGDFRLCRQIEHNFLAWRSIEGGCAMRQGLIEPVEYTKDGVSRRTRECSVRDTLASIVGGEPEVRTPSGLIDVLSATEVIEVKHIRGWKHGLGQVIAYQSYYPHLAKRLHLFSHQGEKETVKYVDLAKSVCLLHTKKSHR